MTGAIVKSKDDIVQYDYDFDMDRAEEAVQKLPSGGNQFFKPCQKKNVVRFLPAPVGRKNFKVYHKHFFQIGNERKNVLCVKQQYGEPCPVCSRAAKMRGSGNRTDASHARALDPTSQVYMNVVDMKNPEKGVQLWTMTPNMFKNIMAAFDNADVRNALDPVKGYNLVFTRVGEGLDTKYSGFTLARESSELPDWRNVLSSQLDLETLETSPTDEQLDDAVDGEYEQKKGKSDNKSSRESPRRSEDRPRREREPGDDDDDSDDLKY